MATTTNTSLSLLLIAKLIPTPEGTVWNPDRAITITGPDTSINDDLARDICGAGTNQIPCIVPIPNCPDRHRAAWHNAKRQIDALITAMNQLDTQN